MLLGALLGTPALGQRPTVPGRDTGPREESPRRIGTVKPRDFADGVRIDWTTKTVELEAQVVLQSGPLELFACSPGTREHESVVIVKARPTHIYQAMGLVGFEPGSPIRYDKAKDRVLPPEGDEVELLVQYEAKGKQIVVPAWRWMVKANDNEASPESLRWVFAGSRRIEGTKLAAEVEGTVACVVDFSSALIAVDTPHTADNEALWLMANSKEVPPAGTFCTLLIRKPGVVAIKVELSDKGVMRIDGKHVNADEIAARFTATVAAGKQVTVVLRPKPDIDPLFLRDVTIALRKAGVPREAIDMQPQDAKPEKPVKPAAKPDGG